MERRRGVASGLRFVGTFGTIRESMKRRASPGKESSGGNGSRVIAASPRSVKRENLLVSTRVSRWKKSLFLQESRYSGRASYILAKRQS